MPVLHLLAGPNGSGKSTFVNRVLQPVTHLPFVNADVIAAQRWPDSPSEHAYEAAEAAAQERSRLLAAGSSFITETVFSHRSELELARDAVGRGYLVHLQVMLVPVDVTVARVAERVRDGGHDVPETKIRERYERLRRLIAAARDEVDRADFFDNSAAAHPFRRIASDEHGIVLGEPDWPAWTPEALL